jgi:hypothetical protein
MKPDNQSFVYPYTIHDYGRFPVGPDDETVIAQQVNHSVRMCDEPLVIDLEGNL